MEVTVPRSGFAGMKRSRRIRWGDAIAPYLFIAPFVIAFLFLFLFPALYSLVLSFFRFRGFGEARFVGWSNYQATLRFHVFWTMLRNTIFYWLMHALPLMVISFLLACLVSSQLIKRKGFYKPMIYLPNVVAAVASGLLFQSMFGTQFGVINSLLGLQVPWLENHAITRFVVVALMIWQRMGWWFVIFLAGLTSINPEVEEAALVDGAGSWQRLLRVTVPLMRGTFMFAFVMNAIGSFRLFAEPNTLLARGGSLAPNAVAPLLNLLVVNLRSAAFGQAAAVGWILFAIMAVVSLLQFRWFRDSSETEGA